MAKKRRKKQRKDSRLKIKKQHTLAVMIGIAIGAVLYLTLAPRVGIEGTAREIIKSVETNDAELYFSTMLPGVQDGWDMRCPDIYCIDSTRENIVNSCNANSFYRNYILSVDPSVTKCAYFAVADCDELCRFVTELSFNVLLNKAFIMGDAVSYEKIGNLVIRDSVKANYDIGCVNFDFTINQKPKKGYMLFVKQEGRWWRTQIHPDYLFDSYSECTDDTIKVLDRDRVIAASYFFNRFNKPSVSEVG